MTPEEELGLFKGVLPENASYWMKKPLTRKSIGKIAMKWNLDEKGDKI
jgi:hypothetical protein